MIRISTTLILGAGASEPFGYPIARVLKGEIISLNDEFLHPHGFTREQFRDFTEHLRKLPIASVDAFIERFPRYEHIGKACIALALARHENDERLFPRTIASAPTWYELLANVLDDGCSPIEENRLAVVTFNYDRSLEYYLTEAIARSREIAFEDAWMALTAIPIIHVYGSIGACPPQLAGAREYATTNESMHRAVQEAAKSLRIVTDAREEDSVFDRAKEVILNSRRVIFLGFGFNAVNVRRLKAFEEKWPADSKREVWCTISGIPPKQLYSIAKDTLHGNWDTGQSDGSIVGLLTNKIALDDPPS